MKKRKIVVPQDFEETESDRLDEDNEKEEENEGESKWSRWSNTSKKKQKKNTPVKKKIAKKLNKRAIKKQAGIIDYINK